MVSICISRRSKNFDQVSRLVAVLIYSLSIATDLTQADVDPLHPDLQTTVPYKDCGSKFASLTYLTVNPPCSKNNCTVTRGEATTMIAHFVPRLNSSILKIQIDQIDPNLGFSTHLLPEFNPCGRRNISCPLIENEKVHAYVLGSIPKSFPPLKINLKVMAMTENRDMYLCISTPLDII